MCCEHDRQVTAELRRRMRAVGGKLTFWKCYRRREGVLFSAYKRVPLRGPGVSASDREKRPPGKDAMDWQIWVERGIHVYRSRRRAVKHVDYWDTDVIIPVLCDIRHLVCAGANGDAVFMQVEITKRNYDRATKQ